ncbi:MAG: hypothetical protein HGB15_09205 [Chlorobaculum sp.]|nr:hypothetical protein [Chlorobaculum sp.]
MHLDSGKTTINCTTCQRHLLREAYQKDGKEGIAPLPACHTVRLPTIKVIRLALRHKHDLASLVSIDDVALQAGLA